MSVFEVKEEFMLNGEPIKILSGAIHYFRIVPEDWEHSLYNLKALGFNTVETYIPWNFHEIREGVFDFEGIKDVSKFVKLAQDLGLMVIARPTPYICAEWDYGGLPAWLLKDPTLKIRTSDKRFMEKVDNYFKELLRILKPLQMTHGGPIIMMQIENEYGSFGNDKGYLRETKNIMEKYGIDVPLFTSDGGWMQALEAGSVCEEDVLPTANFGSDATSNFDALEKFMALNGKKWPLMCMEFWDGWFNLWGEKVIRRDALDVAEEARAVIKRGSINLYMFHGGTNFGFFNGCTDESGIDKPQVTSYDYDALLTEWGDPTPKYFAMAKMLKEELPDIVQHVPRYKKRRAYADATLTKKTALFSNLKNLATPQFSPWPQTMEELGANFGYVLYRTTVKGFDADTKLKLVETSDRAQIFHNETLVATQYQETMGEQIELYLEETNQIDVLVENLGRVNYGPRIYAPSQKKGMRSGMFIDIHYHSNWEQYAIELSDIGAVDYTQPWRKDVPSFYRYEFDAPETEDTFLDVSNLGKGVVFVNGFNIGRYFKVGPHQTLYIPGKLLHQKGNVIDIFETEGNYCETLSFLDAPVIIGES